jgi:membrane-associated phospholipid phosphatase
MDAVLYWNDVAQEAVRRDFTHNSAGNRFDQGPLLVEQPGPTRTSRAMAMVHIAIYEAYARCNPGTLTPYAPLAAYVVNPTIALPASMNFTVGAISGAATEVLTAHWDRQAAYFLERCNSLQETFTDAQFAEGRIYGDSVGKAMLKSRLLDGSEVIDDPVYAHAPGRHRPDPFAPSQGRNSTNWGNVRPFCINAPAAGSLIHHAYLDAPPGLGSPRYNDSVTDVRKEGAAQTSSRSPWETVAGIYWGYDGARGLGVPPRLYNQVVRAFADQHMPGNMLAENARLYALVNAGMADAAIVAWSAKYHYDLWRPVVGIRQHDAGFGHGNGSSDGPNSANCHPGWAPLGRPGTNTPHDLTKTPDFPAYPSGHATFGAVAFKLAAKFYAEKAGMTFNKAFKETLFDFVSDEYNGVNMDPHGDVRTYHRRQLTLGYAVAENALSRVWLGVHWRFDGMGVELPADLTGITLPRKIPRDPAAPDAALNEKRLGGVPAGLMIADEVFAAHFK